MGEVAVADINARHPIYITSSTKTIPYTIAISNRPTYLYQPHQSQWTHNPNKPPPSPTTLQNVRYSPSSSPISPILPTLTTNTDNTSPSPKPRRSRRRPRHGPHQQLDAHHRLLHPPPELGARGPEARAAHDGRAGGRQDGTGFY